MRRFHAPISGAAATWICVALFLSGASLVEAVALTQSNDKPEREVLAVVYAPFAGNATAPVNPPVIRFSARDASAVELRLQPTDVPTTLVFAISDVAQCRRTFESEGSLRPLGMRLVRPNLASGHAFDALYAFAITTKLHDVSVSCTLHHGAQKAAFSVRRFTLAGSARFAIVDADDGCLQPSAVRYCPISTYRLEFDGIPNLDDFRAEGGEEITASPRARLLIESSALVHVRWKDESEDHWREFLLFVVAGVFALGLAAGLEAVKALIAQRDPSQFSGYRQGGSPPSEPDATPAGLKRATCPSPPTPKSSSSAQAPPA